MMNQLLRAFMPVLAAVLLTAAAAAGLRAPFSHATVHAFTKDGKMAIFETSIDATMPEGDRYLWAERFWVAIGKDGRPLHLARQSETRNEQTEEEIKVPAEAQRLWNEAEDEKEGARLAEMVGGGARSYLGGTQQMGAAKSRVEESGTKSCPTHRLVVSMVGLEAVAFEDPCPVPEEKGGARGSISYAWNAEETALAIAWVAARNLTRAHLGVLTKGNLAAIDLLGAGAKLEAAAEQLAAAGFRVAHQAAPLKKRDQAAVYFAPGFKEQADAVAKVLGVLPVAVQPLSWKTPYAVTVALSL